MVLSAVLILLGLLGASWAVSGVLGRLNDTLKAHLDSLDSGELDARVREIEDAVDRLPSKWSDMVDQATRAEGRARAVVKRARAELADSGLVSEGLEAEAAQLQLIDGEGSDGGDVQPVRRSLAHPPAIVPAEPPSWEAQTMMKKFGGRGRS